MQRAALQEHQGPQPRAVLQRVSLDIEDDTLCHLEAMFRPADDVFLHVTVELCEVGAVPGYAHEKVTILLRFLLSIAQCARIDDIELRMPAPHIAHTTHEKRQLAQPISATCRLWTQPEVQQRAISERRCVQFSHRPGNRCRPEAIAARRGR